MTAGQARRQARLLVELALHPRVGAATVLAEGSPVAGAIAIAVACLASTLDVARFASLTTVSDLVYGPQRSAVVTVLLDELGTARTAVVVYLAEQVWAAALVVTALGPLFAWLLGVTAVASAASLVAARRPLRQLATFAAFATALTLTPSALVSLAVEGDPQSALATVGRLIGLAALLWLAALYYHGITAYYGVPPGRALTILVVAAALFYLTPLAVIAVAIIAIVLAAISLDLA